eukprot:Gb_25909 [translate_table: standard]
MFQSNLLELSPVLFFPFISYFETLSPPSVGTSFMSRIPPNLPSRRCFQTLMCNSACPLPTHVLCCGNAYLKPCMPKYLPMPTQALHGNMPKGVMFHLRKAVLYAVLAVLEVILPGCDLSFQQYNHVPDHLGSPTLQFAHPAITTFSPCNKVMLHGLTTFDCKMVCPSYTCDLYNLSLPPPAVILSKSSEGSVGPNNFLSFLSQLPKQALFCRLRVPLLRLVAVALAQFKQTVLGWRLGSPSMSEVPYSVMSSNIQEAEWGKNGERNSTALKELRQPWLAATRAFVQEVSVYGIVAGYCLSASLLSIINKWAIMKFPFPGSLMALQYFSSVAGVLVLGRLKVLEHDKLDLQTMWRFLPAAMVFYLSLFTNSELLLHANVDTFIVFRSAVPIFVAVGETLYLKQPWPPIKTWCSLAIIFVGGLIYVLTDYHLTVTAYSWALAYLVSMSIDFVYIKHAVMTIGLNTWGLVLYNNLEAFLLFPFELIIMGEFQQLKHGSSQQSNWYSLGVLLPVGLSCLFGLSISFFGFSCRKSISATGFTVLGVVNKLLTVVINLVIWDKHATFVGTVGMLICMLGGIFYQQSTTKPRPIPAEPIPNDEEKVLLKLPSSELEASAKEAVAKET